MSEVALFLSSGKRRALGISSRERHSLLPGAPPIAKVVPGYEVIGFMGLFAPAGLPAPIADRPNREVVDSLRSPAIAERFVQQGMRPQSSQQDELKARVIRNNATWKERGLRPLSGGVADKPWFDLHVIDQPAAIDAADRLRILTQPAENRQLVGIFPNMKRPKGNDLIARPVRFVADYLKMMLTLPPVRIDKPMLRETCGPPPANCPSACL